MAPVTVSHQNTIPTESMNRDTLGFPDGKLPTGLEAE